MLQQSAWHCETLTAKYMIRLNIIPQNLKDEIRLENIYESYKSFLIFCCILLAPFIAVFFGLFFYLGSYGENVRNESSVSSESTENYANRVIEINSKLAFIEKMQEKEMRWTSFLADFSKNVSDGISIKSFSVKQAAGTLNISGQAKTRDALLEFERNLKAIKYLSGIEIPLQSLLEKEDIEFNLQLKINPNEFSSQQES